MKLMRKEVRAIKPKKAKIKKRNEFYYADVTYLVIFKICFHFSTKLNVYFI